MLPTCCGVCAVELGWTAQGGARPTLGHNTATSSPHCAARVLRGRTATTPRGEQCAGRASRNFNAVVTTFRTLRYQPAAVLLRSSLGRRVARSAPRIGPQHNHATSALRVLRGRRADIPRGEKRAGRAPHDSKCVAVNFRSLCHRPIAVLVRSSAGRRRGEERAPRWPATRDVIEYEFDSNSYLSYSNFSTQAAFFDHEFNEFEFA